LLAVAPWDEPTDLDFAGRRHQDSSEHFDRRRLASPVWPEVAHQLALAELKTNTVDGAGDHLLARKQGPYAAEQPRMTFRAAEVLDEVADANRRISQWTAIVTRLVVLG